MKKPQTCKLFFFFNYQVLTYQTYISNFSSQVFYKLSLKSTFIPQGSLPSDAISSFYWNTATTFPHFLMLNWIARRASQITLIWLQVKQKENLSHYIPKRGIQDIRNIQKTKLPVNQSCWHFITNLQRSNILEEAIF